jgi:hypothetical protein
MNKEMALKHCAECASFHISMAKLKKAAGEEAEAELHTSHAQHYVGCYKAIEGETEIATNDDSRGTDLKAAGNSFGMTAARDFTKVRPDNVRGALPSMPTLVPRPGQPLIEKTSIDKDTEVIDAFAK